MRKTLISLVLLGILWLIFSPFPRSEIPVFLMTEEAKVIKKGYYGSVFIVEMTFEHSSLETFIKHPLNTQTLFLVDGDFLDRADHTLKLLQQHNRHVGLLLENEAQLATALQRYFKVFNKQPLWVMVPNEASADFQAHTFSKQLNIVAPSLTLQQPLPEKIEKGSFISLVLNADSNIELETVLSWMEKQSFLSIEESLFGHTASYKKSP